MTALVFRDVPNNMKSYLHLIPFLHTILDLLRLCQLFLNCLDFWSCVVRSWSLNTYPTMSKTYQIWYSWIISIWLKLIKNVAKCHLSGVSHLFFEYHHREIRTCKWKETLLDNSMERFEFHYFGRHLIIMLINDRCRYHMDPAEIPNKL